MFILIIWLQGIWLPLHGYSFSATPLWAGISLIPLTVGMFIAGPISGVLSDRFGARPFATGGMIGCAICFALLEALPIDFSYPLFAVLLFLTGLAMASFGSPNRTGVMNALPPEHRGAGSGMNTTFQNSAQVISIGIFFSLMIVGLADVLPHNVSTGLLAHGVPRAVADRAAHLPAISTLFAAFLGYDPVAHLIGAGTLSHLSTTQRAALAQRSFFPSLISAPFSKGLDIAFDFAIVMSLAAAAASWTRGKRYVYAPAAADAGETRVLTEAGQRS
jgi:MFS family permease